MRVCSEPGCPRIQTESRCAEHRSARERARGSAADRGYDAKHRALRADYQRRMDDGQRFTCWRGGEPIDPNNWTLGHCDDDRSQYHGPECPACDYATAGRREQACPHPAHISSMR